MEGYLDRHSIQFFKFSIGIFVVIKHRLTIDYAFRKRVKISLMRAGKFEWLLP